MQNASPTSPECKADVRHDRNALLRAIESTGLLDVPSSTRNIADDEEPIIVTVREGNLVHEVRVWHDDAVAAGSHPSRRTY